MTHLAATATAGTGRLWALAAILAIVWAVGYLIACWLWPFGWCRRCDGSGKRMSPTGRHFRVCKRCGGSARRVRIGRRIWNYFRGKQEASS